ncbi:hypothetical protein DSUL_100138 [Desulfovibrionales bacterium]
MPTSYYSQQYIFLQFSSPNYFKFPANAFLHQYRYIFISFFDVNNISISNIGTLCLMFTLVLYSWCYPS